ncbi:hypothetical protein BDV95DRAFT_494640 [Massariosphaeria phaeospora]|uniref:PSI domain-containing protein n=1 Tax=Massariosphaeria phaeospora TaxID=100035 RepID=A0A7C8MBA6_9PLEO|nr:hypothetical protein BDV95DRAFT_494640 [Massariosphaeria phaeospora]
MAVSNCPSSSSSTAITTSKREELLRARWEDSPKDERGRLERCWGYSDCGDCHRSEGRCGWCGISSTCLPLPADPLSRAFPLLSPIRYKFICATGPERFELRTSGLGCQVSTITFLTSIVTIFCTLFGVLVLYGLVKVAKWGGLASRARTGGWVVYEDRSGEVWVRKAESWGAWWRRMRGKQYEAEVIEVDGDNADERRPLFGS